MRSLARHAAFDCGLVAAAAAAAGAVAAIAAVAVAVAVAAQPGPAPGGVTRGEIVATPRFVPVAGPLLAGDDTVVWIARRDDAVLDLWEAVGGQPPRRIQRFAGSDAEWLSRPRLMASPTTVGLEFAELRAHNRRTLRTRTYAGGIGVPLLRAGARLGMLAIGGDGGAAITSLLAAGEHRDLLAHSDRTERRAVWVTRACASAEIRTVALPAPAAIGVRAAECELRLRRGARIRAGRLRLGLSCAGFDVGCRAAVSVRHGARIVARGSARPNRSTPPYAAANLRLTRSAIALLHRRRQIRVHIRARIGAIVRSTTQTISMPPAGPRREGA